MLNDGTEKMDSVESIFTISFGETRWTTKEKKNSLEKGTNNLVVIPDFGAAVL